MFFVNAGTTEETKGPAILKTQSLERFHDEENLDNFIQSLVNSASYFGDLVSRHHLPNSAAQHFILPSPMKTPNEQIIENDRSENFVTAARMIRDTLPTICMRSSGSEIYNWDSLAISLGAETSIDPAEAKTPHIRSPEDPHTKYFSWKEQNDLRNGMGIQSDQNALEGLVNSEGGAVFSDYLWMEVIAYNAMHDSKEPCISRT